MVIHIIRSIFSAGGLSMWVKLQVALNLEFFQAVSEIALYCICKHRGKWCEPAGFYYAGLRSTLTQQQTNNAQ